LNNINARIAVIILNWNGRALLEKYLPSVVASTYKSLQIIVADNASTDDSINFLRNNFPAVGIISMQKNRGYAGGYNEAVKDVDADIFVLLNSDVEVTPGWLEPVSALFAGDPAIAAAQPKILSYKSRRDFEYAGASGGFIDHLGYPFCRGRLFDTLEEDSGQYDDAREIFWASGACLFIRPGVFSEFGGFDEHFFAHMEEIDLCWRIKNRGHRIMVCPSSVVYHLGGGTLHELSPHKTFLNFRNGLALLFKNLPAYMLWRVFLLRLVLDGVAGLKFLMGGEFKHFIAIIRAHFTFYGHAGLWVKQRKQALKKPLNPNMNGLYPKSIVWQYFGKGVKKFSELK
jgi:GT2 family glycosyltransferase